MIIGVTLTIVHYELVKLRQQEIEVQALIGLLAHGETSPTRWKALKKLETIEYPEDLANQLEQMRLSEEAI